jgi:hypothetical protein
MSPVILLAALLGCDTAETDTGTSSTSCITDWPADGPVSEDADAVASECSSEGGGGCDAAAFITSDAARCIAEADGLAAGTSEWEIWLVYHHGHHVSLWNVSQTDWSTSDGAAGGVVVSVDATTGVVLERSSWERSP